MPAVKKPLDSGSSKKFKPTRAYTAPPSMANISYESLSHKVENMKEIALDLKERLVQCDRIMSNVEDGMEKIQERVRQLQQC